MQLSRANPAYQFPPPVLAQPDSSHSSRLQNMIRTYEQATQDSQPTKSAQLILPEPITAFDEEELLSQLKQKQQPMLVQEQLP